jgi:hypothetical protein
MKERNAHREFQEAELKQLYFFLGAWFTTIGASLLFFLVRCFTHITWAQLMEFTFVMPWAAILINFSRWPSRCH